MTIRIILYFSLLSLLLLVAGCSQTHLKEANVTPRSISWKDGVASIAEAYDFSYTRGEYVVSVSIPHVDINIAREFYQLRESHPSIYRGIEMHTRSKDGSFIVDFFPSSL